MELSIIFMRFKDQMSKDPAWEWRPKFLCVSFRIPKNDGECTNLTYSSNYLSCSLMACLCFILHITNFFYQLKFFPSFLYWSPIMCFIETKQWFGLMNSLQIFSFFSVGFNNFNDLLKRVWFYFYYWRSFYSTNVRKLQLENNTSAWKPLHNDNEINNPSTSVEDPSL